MTTISITNIRSEISKIADKVEHHGERVCVERNGHRAFALVPIEDMELLETLEDKADIEAAKAAMKDNFSITLEELKKELGL